MTVENRVSIVIPAEVKQAVLQKLTEVDELLKPFLIALTAEDRKILPKMGDGSTPFVGKALGYCKSNPQFMPPYVNIPEMEIDYNAVVVLTDFAHISLKLSSGLSDTITLSGSEAYVAALSYYNSVKNAARMNVPGAKPIYEDLKKRFENKGGITPPETPTQQ
ncbi:MAG: hypothetical protein COW85_11885 [Ignavibacteria bacterium CG22_combo_CG10-13_8_21_14_all_37_15]|nr:hypothetical protein [Ignavibacteria bacterium]PIP76875.1 MAG: hypothetical protein COW85_11885 [Ignavibacteria bacterium CG22_combo_CG10-13_8_21_14_all_37_15]PJC57717.1 MAG: hypothetical protein CO025_11915 [Ignavibacteria bacterium CG_4_9_14_0_2_um_filter_37_13]